jgi:hypothetical protein
MNIRKFSSSQNTVFTKILNDTATSLGDMGQFMESIPNMAPLVREDGTEYWPFYSKKLVLALHKYCVLLVIYEYISNSTKPEYEELRAAEIRTDIGDTNANEIEIIAGDMNELRGQIAKLLIACLEKEIDNKEDTDKTYQDIIFSTSEQKIKDKNIITDYLGNLTRDERKIEQLLRAHKIGERWNRGTTVFKYDKKTYALEHEQRRN